MKAVTAFQPREQRLALFAGVLIMCWVVVSVLVQPLWDQVKDLRVSVTSQAEKLSALNSLLGQASAIERDYQDAAPYLESAGDDRAQGSFLNELEALSKGLHLKLNFKPRVLKRDELVNRFEIELDTEGSQEDLLAFLDALLRMPMLVAVERLRVSTVPAKERLLRANLVIQKLTLAPPGHGTEGRPQVLEKTAPSSL